MSALLLLALLGAPALTPEAVIEALGEPGCPRLFDLLGPKFQKARPREVWPAFCDAVGRLEDLSPRGEDEHGLQTYRARGPSGEVEIRLRITPAGKVAGLAIRPVDRPAAIPSPDPPSPYTATALPERLREIIAHRGVPALGGLLMIDGEVRAHEVVGVRKYGDPTPATKDDVWHLGSDTKAMTALLAATVVDAGTWRWTTTVPELFPKVKVHPGYKDVTLAMLLRHRGGVVANIEQWPPDGDRQRAVVELLAQPPGKPGTFSYSNARYIMVGAAIERALGGSWESLLRKRLFEPLGMRSCGFGVMAHAPKVDQPWPHRVTDGRPAPVFADANADNPPSLGPAGTVSCSLVDWAKFVGLFATGGPKGLVTPESFAELQRFEDGYAGGWGTLNFSWTREVGLGHSGSNTMNFCTAYVARDAHVVMLGVSNVADAGAKAIDDASAFLTSQHLKR